MRPPQLNSERSWASSRGTSLLPTAPAPAERCEAEDGAPLLLPGVIGGRFGGAPGRAGVEWLAEAAAPPAIPSTSRTSAIVEGCDCCWCGSVQARAMQSNVSSRISKFDGRCSTRAQRHGAALPHVTSTDRLKMACRLYPQLAWNTFAALPLAPALVSSSEKWLARSPRGNRLQWRRCDRAQYVGQTIREHPSPSRSPQVHSPTRRRASNASRLSRLRALSGEFEAMWFECEYC